MLEIPINCPCCNSKLERVTDQLYCRNVNCSATSSKQLLHFIKVMNIKGLGEKTLDKLPIDDINDIYSMSNNTLVEILGERIGNKIFLEIEKSKSADLSLFIAAFGIPLIGNTAGKKLSKKCRSIWDINSEVCKSAGLGEKATSNLLSWISSNMEIFGKLPIITKTPNSISSNTTTLYKVVITGKLKDFPSRNKAKEFLESKGIQVLSSLSSNTNYLICDIEDSTSSSYKKAMQLNIPVITMNNLLNIL